ncbi:hypothetical protein D3C87_1855050 [compost metagenome]
MPELDKQVIALPDGFGNLLQTALVDEAFGAPAICGLIVELHLIRKKIRQTLPPARFRLFVRLFGCRGGIAGNENGHFPAHPT